MISGTLHGSNVNLHVSSLFSQFSNFMFVSAGDENHPTKESYLKEKNLLRGSKFVPLRFDPRKKGKKPRSSAS